MSSSHALRTNLGSTLTLTVGTTATGYGVMFQGVDFGTPTWSTVKTGPRGLLGALPAYGTPEDRTVTLPILVQGSSADQLAQRVNALVNLLEEMRRGGGSYVFRPRASTDAYRVVFDVLGCAYRAEWTETAETSYAAIITASLDVAPLAEGDPLPLVENWSDNAAISSLAWTIDNGATPTISADQLVPNGLTEFYARRTMEGYSFTDLEIEIEYLAGTTTAVAVQPTFGITAAGTANLLRAGLDSAGIIGVRMIAGGAPFNLATGSTVTPTTNTRYWVTARRQGALCSAEYWTSRPTPRGNPAGSVYWNLTADHHARFSGGWGFHLDPAHANDRVESVVLRPFTYKNLDLPEVIQLQGVVPGTAGPRMDVEITPSGGSLAPAWAMLGWWAKPRIFNLCWNGDFEDNALGWTNAAVSGVTAAATSVARVTTAARNKFGGANLEIVCLATTDTGGSFTFPGRFKRGRAYLALAWMSAASATTNARVKLGVSGDVSAGTAAALTTTPTLRSTLWRPTADTNNATLVCGISAATGTTMSADGVILSEAIVTTLSASIASAGATTCTVISVPHQMPALPAKALISPLTATPEIVNVLSYSGTTLTIDRGLDGSTATTHSSAAEVCFLPELRPHFEGRGAMPVFGIIEGEAYAAVGGTNTWAAAADVNHRGGASVYDAALTAGAGNSYAEWYVDPALTLPDDYTQASEVLVEVYGRCAYDEFVDSPTVTLSASAGLSRTYSAEYRDIGRRLTVVTAAGFRFVHLGTVALPVDPANPLRWLVRADFSWGSSTTTSGLAGIDYLVLVPPNQRAIMQDGAAASTVPDFVSSTSETIRRINADLTTTVRTSPYPATRDVPLGGATLELPASTRGWEVVVKLSNAVPGDPTVDSTGEQLGHTTTVSFALTPRFAQVRDA